jgi:hypothetical protein
VHKVANWHLVVAYDERAAGWLTGQGYQHPAVHPGNRLPTLPEIEAAARALSIGPDAPLVIDGVGMADSFTIRGDLVLELHLLRKLSEQSGQLWVYPDSGSPAIVVDPSTDPEAVAAAWLAAQSAEDCWAAFLGKASPDPDGASGRGA